MYLDVSSPITLSYPPIFITLLHQVIYSPYRLFTKKHIIMAKFQLLNPVLRVVGQKYDEKGIPVGEINRNVQNAGNK